MVSYMASSLEATEGAMAHPVTAALLCLTSHLPSELYVQSSGVRSGLIMLQMQV